MKYVEVLPLTKTGAEDTVFTYETEEEIQIGSLVSIPLRNRFVRGLVTGIVKKPAFQTKPVKKIQSFESVITEVQLKIAKKIAEYYFAPLGDCINSILSFDFGKKRRLIRDQESGTRDQETPLELTKDQEKVFKTINTGKASSKYLLYGVTGSGKTEIYLQLIAEALKNGSGAIVLVPEISLTPQTVSRFQKRFGDKVAVWHSGMKETEKYFTWEKIKSGEKRVVVGARSAIFAPVSGLQYIIIDEEHESSYKQDQTPRYETGRVAEWLSDLTGAKLVLGSATPRIESFKKAEEKIYSLCVLDKRIIQESMPPTQIVDLRDEFQKGNKSIFSESLFEAIKEALKEKKQVMLFVNRRGASTFVVCRDCGFVDFCPHCDVPLVYHPSEGQVVKCHHCNYKKETAVKCPECGSFAFRYFGLGTQKVELEAQKLFPKAKIVRMDRDTTQKRGSHAEIFESFSKKDIDIIIGTQLIAKGWDLPNVSVVGMISADTTLNIPDFRSAERTFDLLTQMGGRTGRGVHAGKVIIQTYSPDNFAIVAAKNHDFISFYHRELSERKKYYYPPYSHLIKLTYNSSSSEKAELEAEKLAEILEKSVSETENIIGPSPAFIPKLAGRFRWQIVVKTKEENFSKILSDLKKSLKAGWSVDINPDNLL